MLSKEYRDHNTPDNQLISVESIIDFSFKLGSLEPINNRPVQKMKLGTLLHRLVDVNTSTARCKEVYK